MLKGTILEYESCIPAQSKMAMNTTNKPTQCCVHVCWTVYGYTPEHTAHIVSAVAQHSQADSLQHSSGNAPKEKPNSFNRGRAVKGQLISAWVFIS